MTGKTDFGRIIDRHIADVDAKIQVTDAFLAKEGKPRHVKQAMQRDMESMFDKGFTPDPITPPGLNPHWSDTDQDVPSRQ